VGTQITRIVTDLSQAPLSQTGDPLDIALNGDGFFTVSTPDGIRYTRNGQLTEDAQGHLQTDTGYTLLGTNGKPIDVSAAKSQDDISIAADGTVRVGTSTVGTIAVVSLTGARKEGDTLFTGASGARPKDTAIAQGYLEGSGVNPAMAMVDMIVSLRAYESTQRVLHSIDDELGKAANSVGSATG